MNTNTNDTSNDTRARRLAAGLTLDEAGRRAGIERSRLSRAERGYAVLSGVEAARLDLVLGKAENTKTSKGEGACVMAYEPKHCEGACRQLFTPTGPNTKRCPQCRLDYNRARSRAYHHAHKVLKGYDQKGEKNNAWLNGSSPSHYQRIAFEAYGRQCDMCKRQDGQFVVHHRDHDRANNTVENLQVLCKRCHQVHHACADNLPRGPTRPPEQPVTCAGCHVDFKATTGRQRYCGAKCRIAHAVKLRGLRKARITLQEPAGDADCG